MKSQMSINDAIGNWILVRLMNYPKELIGQTTGIYAPDGWIKAKLCGIDELGIWLENPYFTSTDFVDSKGNPIPPDQRKEVTKTTAVLIRWQFIASIIHVEADEANQDKHSVRLGFQPPAPKAIEEGR
jgi:hypothetical protein